MKKSILVFYITLLAAVFYSCDTPIGLGSRLNIDPPVIHITGPDFMENISRTLEITGIATDLQEVVLINVTVERVSSGEPWKQEWQGERGFWRNRGLGNTSWQNTDGEWSAYGGQVNWAVTLSMDGAPNGDYIITAGVINNVSNEGAPAQRRIVIDTEEPAVRLLNFDDDWDSDKINFNEASAVFDTYRLRDPAVLSRLHNQSINIHYEVSDRFSISRLVFQLADNTGNAIYSEKTLDNPRWSNSIAFSAEDIRDAYGIINEKRYMQIISYATDAAGNTRSRHHVWLVYWPEADRPWASGVGVENRDDAEERFPVFPGSDVQVQVFDDDGIDKVIFRIFRGEQELSGYEEPQVSESRSGFFSFSFQAPGVSDTYRIEFDCFDIHGTQCSSAYCTRYFYVVDTSSPQILIAAPLRNPHPLLGDNRGTFKFEGYTSDGIDPVRLSLAWIRPGNIAAESQIRYQTHEYGGWNITSGPHTGTDSAGDRYWTDSYNNMIWEITLGEKYESSEYDDVWQRDFSKSLNLFSDLHIGIVPFSSQTFVLRVQNRNGRALTLLHNVRGDITPPQLEIIAIERHRDGADIKTYLIEEDPLMDSLREEDKLYISGTWNDDSFTYWNHADRADDIGNIWRYRMEASWNEIKMAEYAYVEMAAGSPNTWRAGPLVINDEETLKGGGRIEASLRDLAGNISTVIFNARVDTDTPILQYIGSSNEDRSYKSGDIIDIYLAFNKEVAFNGTGAALTLNNGATAARITTGLNTHHVFRYTVGAAGDINRLNVTSINNFAPVNAENIAAVMDIPMSRNLSNSRNIRIDNTPPLIQGVRSLSGNGHYRAGQTLYLLAAFNEPIEVINASDITLTLNSGGAGINPSLSGRDSLLFTYIVGSGENTPPNGVLAATGLVLGSSGSIRDEAGNVLTNLTFPAGYNISDGANARTIVIDTTAPGNVTITAITHGATVQTVQTFSITGAEPNARLEYSITIWNAESNAWGAEGTWRVYSNPVTISASGRYQIRARQIDRAGNEGSVSSPVEFTINRTTPLLERLSGSAPGIYGLNRNININIHLRDEVNVTGNPTLTLNVQRAGNTWATASLSPDTRTNTKVLTFVYSTQSGDTVNVLDINYGEGTPRGGLNLNGAVLATSTGSIDVTPELISDWNRTNKQNLSFYTSIEIDTSTPELVSMVLSAQALTLVFDKPISKGTGNITLTQVTNTYRAPAVLSRNEYLRFGGDSSLGSYYTRGTNGTNAAGVPDLSEKYILNFNIDPDNQALRTILTSANAHVRVVPAVASAVTISSNGLTMTVDLGPNSGYALGVRGVGYNIAVDNSIVQDSQGNPLGNNYSWGGLYNKPGINPPVIRVQKGSGSYNAQPVNFTAGAGPATTVWVRNAALQFSSTRPGEDWHAVSPFHVRIPWGTEGAATNYLHLASGTNRLSLMDIRNNGGRIQGHVYRNTGNNQITMSWWLSGAQQMYDVNNSTPPTTTGSGVWLNPYEHTIYQGDRSNEGDIYVRDNLWVNLSTAGVSDLVEQNDSPAGTGWLRVNRTTVIPGVNGFTAVAEQPRFANVKIDTQTPGAAITYSITTQTSTPNTGPFSGTTRPNPSIPAASSIPYTAQFQLGDATYNGLVYGIRAQASLNGNTSVAYEVAARSVIQYTGFNATRQVQNFSGQGTTASLRTHATSYHESLQLWLRGGENPTGDNSSAGFPLEWDENKTTGASLLTNAGNTGTNIAAAGTWFWMTWDIASQAYFHFIAGTTITTSTEQLALADVQLGPKRWAWGKNRWSWQYHQFILHPGLSLSFNDETITPTNATDVFEFYNPFGSNR